ncbi:class I SAM-dependent methyltransferase [Microlunatus ginsengisoli]|uniref:Class I SAM-dependent methyltransferase n=1 Tax=Microlunatus ginsengisoli TaxID=363863 RepID=A0ABP6ZJ45_9ACTN
MAEVEGTRTFRAAGSGYDGFMGRYSAELAGPFADFAGVGPGTRVLDVGCGPGAFTAVAVGRAGAARVAAVDPTPSFVELCRRRHPGVDVRSAAAERLPFDDASFDCAAAQLVFHFVSDPEAAVGEMSRVLRPGGVLAACVWDFAEGMEMLRTFWDAALSIDPDAPDEARTLRLGREGELSALFASQTLTQVTETTLTVGSRYGDFEELWNGFLAGVGPAGAYCASLPPRRQAALRDALFDRLGRPAGSFSLAAVARAARAIRP